MKLLQPWRSVLSEVDVKCFDQVQFWRVLLDWKLRICSSAAVSVIPILGLSSRYRKRSFILSWCCHYSSISALSWRECRLTRVYWTLQLPATVKLSTSFRHADSNAVAELKAKAKGKGKAVEDEDCPPPSAAPSQENCLSTLDIFAGCGGLSEGLRQAGAVNISFFRGFYFSNKSSFMMEFFQGYSYLRRLSYSCH